MAVAIWARQDDGSAPDADTLLAARLRRGWEPTPTATTSGPKILGHAGCALSARAEPSATAPVAGRVATRK